MSVRGILRERERDRQTDRYRERDRQRHEDTKREPISKAGKVY